MAAGNTKPSQTISPPPLTFSHVDDTITVAPLKTSSPLSPVKNLKQPELCVEETEEANDERSQETNARTPATPRPENIPLSPSIHEPARPSSPENILPHSQLPTSDIPTEELEHVSEPNYSPDSSTYHQEHTNSNAYNTRMKTRSQSLSRESTPLSAIEVDISLVSSGGRKRAARQEGEAGVRKKIKSSEQKDVEEVERMITVDLTGTTPLWVKEREVTPGKRREREKPERIKEDILSSYYDEPGKRKPPERIGVNPNRGVGVETRKSNISKEHSGRTTKRKSASMSVPDDKVNNDYCETCHGPGEFICCDACPRSFHFSCVEPPLTTLETGMMENWYCNVCRVEKKPPPKPPKGIFQKLIDNVNRMNPTIFMLPKEIKEHFKGVGTNNAGDYVESSEMKQLKIGKNGIIEEPDYVRLKDKSGKPILCYKCGKSALHGWIIPCDHCSLYWHMDCLTPPMINPPSVGRKWMCPNHADHVMPRVRKRKHPVIINPSNPYSSKNNGDILIINDADDERLETEEYTWGGVTYRLPEKAVKFNFLNAIKLRKPSPSLAKTVSESSPAAVSSPLSPVSSISSTTLSLSSLPANVITKAEPKAKPDDERTGEVAANGPEIEGASREEIEQWLSGLSAFQEDIAARLRGQPVGGRVYKKEEQKDDYALRTLIQVAMGSEVGQNLLNGDHIQVVDGEQLDGELNTEEDVSPSFTFKISNSKYQQLLAIQKLMKIKGENALLAFLRDEGT